MKPIKWIYIFFSIISTIILFSVCSGQQKILNDPSVVLPDQRELEKISEKAIKLNDNAIEYFNKAIISNSKEDFDKALSLLDKALALEPNYHMAYTNKASILLTLKRYDEANTAFENAIKIRPHAAEYYIGQGLILAKMGKADKASENCRYAIAAFNLRLKNDPDNLSIRTDRAVAVYLLGYKDIAMKELKDIRKRSLNNLTIEELIKKIEYLPVDKRWDLLGD